MNLNIKHEKVRRAVYRHSNIDEYVINPGR